MINAARFMTAGFFLWIAGAAPAAGQADQQVDGVASGFAGGRVGSFSGALSAFTAAIEGTFGDEGGEVVRALEQLSAALPDPDTQSPAVPRVSLLESLDPGIPVIPPASYRFGYERLKTGDHAGAIAAFRKAAAADPLVVEPATRHPLLARAIALLRQGEISQARALLDARDPMPASSEAFRAVGLIHLAASEYEKAAGSLISAIDLHPDDERSRLALARVLTLAGRDGEAERILIETVQRLPDSALASWWLGLSFERANRFAEARQALERAADAAVAGRSQLYSAVGRLASRAGDFERGIESFRRAIEANPGDAAARRQLAAALLQQDRIDEALAEITAALRTDPGDATAHMLAGQILLNTARTTEAVDALRRAVELAPAHTEARYALATALTRLGRVEEAAREFERIEQEQRAAVGDRRRTMALDVLKEEAALREADGNHHLAAVLWQQVVEREPGRAAHHVALAALLLRAGRLDEAIGHYEQAAALEQDPGVYRRLADLYVRVGRVADAERARRLGFTQGPKR